MSTQIDLGPVLSVPKGDWNANTTYERLNIVRHNSSAWICNVATSKGVEPTENSTDWYLQVKDTSSVTSVNGMKGDVVIGLTETETPPANDSSNRIATTEWVTGKLGDVDLSGIKDDTVLAAQNAGSLEVGTGELTSAELATIIENNDSMLRTLIAQEVAKYLPLTGGTMTGDVYDKNSSLAFLPAGAVFAFAANSAPSGCLLCNGAAVSRTTYAALFSAIGTTYGKGDGSTTFNLPNLTDKFIQGSGTAGTVKSAGLPEIYGDIATPTLNNISNAFAAWSGDNNVASKTKNAGWGEYENKMVSFSAKRSNSIYGKSTTVQPPAMTMRYYIKY